MKKILYAILCMAFLIGCTAEVDTMEQENTIVVMETTMGDITIRLYDDFVPATAGNFKKLVSEGFYDGIIFHRVIPNFMIQGGDPEGRGTGGPGYTIPDEFHKEARNVRGTISMANSGPNSGGSQFFINIADNSYLDFDDMRAPQSKHAVFGEVIEGMDVVDAISQVQRNGQDKPSEDVIMKKVYIKE